MTLQIWTVKPHMKKFKMKSGISLLEKHSNRWGKYFKIIPLKSESGYSIVFSANPVFPWCIKFLQVYGYPSLLLELQFYYNIMHCVSGYIFPEILNGCKFFYSAIKPSRKQQKCMIMANNNLDRSFIYVKQLCIRDGNFWCFIFMWVLKYFLTKTVEDLSHTITCYFGVSNI